MLKLLLGFLIGFLVGLRYRKSTRKRVVRLKSDQEREREDLEMY